MRALLSSTGVLCALFPSQRSRCTLYLLFLLRAATSTAAKVWRDTRLPICTPTYIETAFPTSDLARSLARLLLLLHDAASAMSQQRHQRTDILPQIIVGRELEMRKSTGSHSVQLLQRLSTDHNVQQCSGRVDLDCEDRRESASRPTATSSCRVFMPNVMCSRPSTAVIIASSASSSPFSPSSRRLISDTCSVDAQRSFIYL